MNGKLKGHGSDARGSHAAGVEQIGLQPHGMAVPPNAMAEIETHLAAGGYLGIPSATRPTIINAKTYNSWKASGTPLVKPEGNGYRVHIQGKGGVYTLPGQLRYGSVNK